MNDNPGSLIFIPDITGFTRFVNETEIKHGQHIISELLEILIQSNRLGMKVSEVEGDAVLFYKEGTVPHVNELLGQARTMFLKFHNHLQAYETRRMCHCGACTSAHNLSLKFIVHQGEIGFTNILNRIKPYGAEIVLGHKLLKNSIDVPEYILFSEKYFEQLGDLDRGELPLGQGSDEYLDVGRVDYRYVTLTPLKQHLDPPGKPPLPPKSSKPVIKSIVIDRLLDDVYQVIIELDLRLLWNRKVDRLDFEPGRVNRIGTRHTCLFPLGRVEFQTVQNEFEKDTRVYGEEVLDAPFASKMFIYYVLTPVDQSTGVRVELHLFPKSIIGWIMAPLLKFRFKKQIGVSILSLKKLLETS